MEKQITLSIGFEVYEDGERKVRVTPIDGLAIPCTQSQATFIRLLFGAIDMTDKQPGDGEADIPLPALGKVHPLVAKLVPNGAANVFVRISERDLKPKATK